MKKIRPLYDRILVARVDESSETTTAGGIYIPPSAQDAVQKALTGNVIAVGQGRLNTDGSVQPMSVKQGDVVYFGRYAGTEIDDNTVIIKEDEILGIAEQ